VIEQKINEFFGDAESTGFGNRLVERDIVGLLWISFLRGVLCLHFPQLLSSPELRPHYPMHAIRVLIQSLIVGAILFGITSSILAQERTLAFTGLLLATAAAVLGGSSVQINGNLRNGPAIAWIGSCLTCS